MILVIEGLKVVIWCGGGDDDDDDDDGELHNGIMFGQSFNVEAFARHVRHSLSRQSSNGRHQIQYR
jgi:hypothetical protein